MDYRNPNYTNGSTLNRLSGGSALKTGSPKDKKQGKNVKQARHKTLSETFALEFPVRMPTDAKVAAAQNRE